MYHIGSELVLSLMCVPQLLRGGSDEMLESFHLQNDPAVYTFTKEGAAITVSLNHYIFFFNERPKTK